MSSLLAHVNVDMLDMDVQGAEFTVFDEATMDVLARQVLRIHIGTHSKGTKNLNSGEKAVDTDVEVAANAERTLGPQELALARTFMAHGWRPRWLVGQNAGNCDHVDLFRVTPRGPVCMADGVLSFVNGRLEHTR